MKRLLVAVLIGLSACSDTHEGTPAVSAQTHADSVMAAGTTAPTAVSYKDTALTKQISYKAYNNTPNGPTWYDVVIRPIDPKKEDYKAYCRYIVKDIRRKSSSDDIVVYIFDNEKAFHLENMTMDEMIQRHRKNTKAENNLIETHIIAGYGGFSPTINYAETGMTPYEMSYYEEAARSSMAKYRSSEIYHPSL